LFLTNALMVMGLVYYATNDNQRALQSWREGIQWAYTIFEYDRTYIGLILNNIGVTHYELGDFRSSFRAFEESMALQRKFLQARSNHEVGCALRCLATTMTNIAMTHEECGQIDKAIEMLQESETVLESLYDPIYDDVTETVRLYANRLSDTNVDSHDKKIPVPLHNLSLSTTELSRPTVDVNTSSLLFGNIDGVPNGYSAKHGSAHLPHYGTFVFLGSLVEPWTPERQVHDAVERHCRWQFTARLSSFKLERCKPSVRVDVDAEMVVDAEQCLSEIHEQAMQHLESHEFNEAIDLFRGALRDHQQKYGAVHHLNGSALHNIGIVQLLAQQYNQAILTFREALDVRIEALGPQHTDVLETRFQLSLANMAIRDFDRAQSELTIVKQACLQGHGYGRHHLPSLLNNLGVINFHQKDIARARKSLDMAHEHLLRMQKDEQVNEAFCTTLQNLGYVMSIQGNHVGALHFFERALTYCRSEEQDSELLEIRVNIEYLTSKVASDACIFGRLSCGSDLFSWLPVDLFQR
jgi:tetratricopeptide (TPR) repeat protein